MRQRINSEFKKDADGNPTGGRTEGIGIDIKWQNGPIGISGTTGAFVEGVIQAAFERLEFYQKSKFKCRENDEAMRCLESALKWLDIRTADRRKRGVEGSYRA